MAAEHFFRVNGSRVVSGRITMPLYGAWTADLVLASNVDIPKGAVTLTLGNLTLKGTVYRAEPFGGSATVWIVGGGGAWRKKIPAKGYSHTVGVKLSTVLVDAARECGERIVVTSDRVIGTGFTRKADRADRVLKFALQGKWWIDPEGVTQTKARDASSIASAFTVVNQVGSRGLFTIMTENYKDWVPGRTFAAPTVTGTQTISSVTIIEQDGKSRLDVLNSSTKEERLLQEFRSIIRDELVREEFGAIVEYEITSAEEMEIGCKPINTASGWPALSGVKLKAGLCGETVTPTVGKKALIVFLDNDPTQFRCIGVEGPNEKSSVETTGDYKVTAGGLFKVNGASNFVALANLVDARLSQMQAIIDAHVHPTGVGPSGPPATPIGSLASVACTKLKTD